MSPLSIQIYSKKDDSWREIGFINPGDNPGSIPDNRPVRQAYLLECSPDDSCSRLLRSEKGTVVEIVKVLRRNESYELNITTTGGLEARLRFTHVNEGKTSAGKARSKA